MSNNVYETEKIKSIEDYIKKVSELISNKNSETTVVYRGEDEAYPSPCQPNIFRENILSRNKYFEKSLFDEMRANDLTDGKTHLERAIDAQHGGFPSRLLDVSYNSLVALYFAVTAGGKLEEYSKDGEVGNDNRSGKDGAVYIFFIKKIFCPSGQNINLAYDSIIERRNPWLCEQEIFQRNHKLIDHIKKNKRVIAQQGAFILFQGDSIKPIPSYDYERVVIDANSKKMIREKLKELFGIHTGSIYPEVGNLIDDMISRSMKISVDKFQFNTELDMVINTLERELNIYYSKLIKMICDNQNEEKLLAEINHIETNIYEYKIEFKELYRFMKDKTEEIEILKEKMEIYNQLVKSFSESVSSYLYDIGIEFSQIDLLLEDDINEE